MLINNLFSHRSNLKPLHWKMEHISHRSLQDGDVQQLSKAAAALLKVDPRPLEWAVTQCEQGKYVPKI